MKTLRRKKVLSSLLALSIIGCYNASWGLAANLDGTVTGGNVDVSNGVYDAVFGKKDTYDKGVGTIEEYKKLPVAEAIGSVVNISNSKINEAYGGIAGYYDDDRNYQQGGKANNNILKITNTEVKNGVIGGYAYSGINYRVNDVGSIGNRVILDDVKILETNQLDNVIVVNPMTTSGFNENITVGGFATHSGASSHSAIAVGNTLEIYNSNINTVISGGIASGGSAGNGGFLPYGDGEGYVDAKIATNNNMVIIDKSVTGNEQEYKDIYGGYSGSSSVGNTVESSSNTIKINNGSTVYGYVYGGVAFCIQNNTGNINSNGSNVVADIHSNAVTIADSDVMGDVYGAYLYENGNMNITTKPEIDQLVSKLNNNKVEVLGNSKLSGSVYGADGYISNSNIKDGAEVIGNSVSFTQNSYIGDTDIQSEVFGGSGYSYVSSTFESTKRTAGNVNVTENAVTIDTTQTVYADIYGGYAKSEGGGVNDRTGKGNGHGNAGDATASKNTVNLFGGKIIGNVFGGYALSEADGKGYEGVGIVGRMTAKDNKIVLKEKVDVSEASLYGSNLQNNEGDVSGNTLIVDGWYGQVKSVANFQNIEFNNINWVKDGTVMDITAGGADSALVNTKISLNGISFSGGTDLEQSESMVLIKSSDTNADLGISLENVDESKDFTAGVAAVGTGKASLDGENLIYTIESIGVNPQINMLASNYAATAAFVNQSTDLLVDTLDGLSVEDGYGIKTFAAVYGNRSKYDVENELKINGWSSLVGIGNTKAINSGDFSWGVFYENGSGNYRTYNSFKDEFFRGDGSVVYNGGGVAAKLASKNGIYYEGSLRAGMLKNEMSNALKDASGANYNYKAENNYYGGHIGVGRLLALDNDREFDIYGRFYHTKTNGDNFMVSDDAFALGDITSNRVRIGGRLRTNTDAKWNTYYGLAWEYEFDGEADVTAQGMAVPAQSLQGSTFIGELGVNYAPSKESSWSFDAKVRGFAGQREGFSGKVQVNYGF